jgi:hypothetical protein
MPTGYPLGIDSTSGIPFIGKLTDSLITNLNGASSNGIIARIGNGIHASGLGDVPIYQVPYSAFAVAGTDASVLIGTMPANSIFQEGSCYVETAGDSVLTLALDIRVGSVDLGLNCDGLTALAPEWTSLFNQNVGVVPRQPALLNIYARAISTGGNLNTMTQGLFDFCFSYSTGRVAV